MTIWLNGMTCLNCARGVYNGYDTDKTGPCNKCGHQAPASMSRFDLLRAVRARDARLAAERSERSVP